MAKILIETSARHVHLSQEAVEILFGKNYQLTEKKRLSQPTEFACEERVTVVGPKKSIQNVSILGPCRAAVQIELSATDVRSIGAEIFVRESGDLKNTAPCKLIGPAGELEISEGLIVAKRHIHCTPEFASENGLSNGQIIGIKIEDTGRSMIFGDTVVRIRDTFTEAMHIDTDESNAAGVVPAMFGEIIK